MLRLSAAWLVPVSAPPIADGVVLIDDHGRIVAVGEAHAVPTPEDARSEHFADAILLPGLINTHTHLELTGLPARPTTRSSGLDQAHHRPEGWSLRGRLFPCRRSRRTRLLGGRSHHRLRHGNSGSVIAALHALNGSGIAHHEVFDLHSADPDVTMKRFGSELQRLAHHATGRVQTRCLAPRALHCECRGVSPHRRPGARPWRPDRRPYRRSTRRDPAAAGLHWTFADFLRERGVGRCPTSRSLRWRGLTGLGAVVTNLCAHAIHADLADAHLLRRHGCAVAHCPAATGAPRGRCPGPALRRAGDSLGLGTDSEVSVVPLDLIAEAREARKLAGWTAAETVRALTLGGAEALGLDSSCGSSSPGDGLIWP